MRTFLAVALVAAASFGVFLHVGCGSDSGAPVIQSASLTPGASSGFDGLVTRGPIHPVATQGEVNDEPFAAEFIVFKDGVEIARFDTNGDGRFSVALAPGNYAVQPGPMAPVMRPERQTREVTVRSDEFAHVNWSFDTGIR